MKPYLVTFKIDDYEIECLIIDESEDKAKEQVSVNYLGIEGVHIQPVTNKMLLELDSGPL